MAKVEFRPAHDINPGDEISLNLAPDQYGEWHGSFLVTDRKFQPSGRVILTISADPGARVRVRPQETA